MIRGSRPPLAGHSGHGQGLDLRLFGFVAQGYHPLHRREHTVRRWMAVGRLTACSGLLLTRVACGAEPSAASLDVAERGYEEQLRVRGAKGADVSVALVAPSVGFPHLGRFATANRRMYGETPYETQNTFRTADRRHRAQVLRLRLGTG